VAINLAGASTEQPPDLTEHPLPDRSRHVRDFPTVARHLREFFPGEGKLGGEGGVFAVQGVGKD